MAEKLGNTRGFRPSPKNRERLEYASKLGLDVTGLINQALEKYLPDALKKSVDARRKELHQLLESPIP